MSGMFFSLSRRALLAWVCGLALLGSVPPVQAEGMARLQAAVQKALVVLQDPALAGPAKRPLRRSQLRAAIYSEFDFNALARGAIGHTWRAFSEQQKRRFVPLLKKLLEETYMDIVERYRCKEVRFLKEVRQSSRTIKVESVVVHAGSDIRVTYRLHQTKRGWKVFDVVIEGVSVVANYRSQFKKMLHRGTSAEIETMLANLEHKLR